MRQAQLTELLLQSLEHEMAGVQVYEAALECVVNDSLRIEWEDYLEQTREHVTVLRDVCEQLDIDPEQQSPGREIVRELGLALVEAVRSARACGNEAAAQLVACECVLLAETKDHVDWELIGQCAKKLRGVGAQALQQAYDQVEDEEDEHLYHTKGWCRELWRESLGMKAMLPPPEERKHVKTAIGAARAEQASERDR